MTNKEYNRWFNYETWLVKLWMDNEEGSYGYWLEQTADYAPREDVGGLARLLQSEHEEALPELSGFASDLLNAAMSEVNWYEIASHLIEDWNADHKDEEKVA